MSAISLEEQNMQSPNPPSDMRREIEAIATRKLPDGKRPRTQKRIGRMLLIPVTLLIGILLGVAVTVLYIVATTSNNPLPVTSSTAVGSIVVQTSASFLTDVTAAKIQTAGLPGTVKNVQVQLASGDQMTVSGDDEVPLLGGQVTNSFTLVFQPYIDACQLHMRVLSAHVAGLPVTLFASLFENQINQQMQFSLSALPKGFTYCLSEVHTEPAGLFITYTATPQ